MLGVIGKNAMHYEVKFFSLFLFTLKFNNISGMYELFYLCSDSWQIKPLEVSNLMLSEGC